MSFADDALRVLAGGLPAVIDYGNQVPANAQGDTGALSARSASTRAAGEKKAPTGTVQDREPGLLGAVAGLSAGAMVGIGVAVVALVGLVVLLVRR